MESKKIIWIHEHKSIIRTIFARKLSLTVQVVLGKR